MGFKIVPNFNRRASAAPFVVGQAYTRQEVYELVKVPVGQRRGNWETGYTRWGNDLYVFSTVGSAATGGFDYKNEWEKDGIFKWFAKNRTRLGNPLIQWILNEAEHVFIFTRPAVRHAFTYQGLGTPVSSEDQSPVLIRWLLNRDAGRQ